MKNPTRSSVAARLCCSCLLGSLLTIAITPTRAAVVDAFLGEPVSLRLPGSSNEIRATEGGLFETRRLWLGFGDQTMTVAGGLLEYRLFPPEIPNSGNKRGYFSISYETSAPVDLIASGFTSIRITFERLHSEPEPAFLLDLTLSTGSTGSPYHSVRLDNFISEPVESTTVVDVPLSMFTRIDLSEIRRLEIDAARLWWPTEIQISKIELVPEPGTCGLLAFSGVFLLLRRKRGS